MVVKIRGILIHTEANHRLEFKKNREQLNQLMIELEFQLMNNLFLYSLQCSMFIHREINKI